MKPDSKVGARQNAVVEDRYRRLFESVSDGIFLSAITPEGLPGKFLDVNESACRRLGYTREELLQKSALDIDPQLSRARIAELVVDVLAKGKVVFTTEHQTKDGRRIPLEISTQIFEEDGQTLVLSTARELTDRREVEFQRQLLETVVNFMPTATALIRGSDLTLQFVNPAYRAIAEGKQILGRTLNEVWPETGEEFSSICRSVLETGETFHAVDQPFTIRRRPDIPIETAYFTWWLYRVRLPDGGRWGLLNTAWETTERVRAEKALRVSEQEFRTLAEAMPQIVWVTRADGWNIYYNQKWVDYTGLTFEESHGHGWNKPFHPDDQQRAWDAWQHAIKHNAKYSMECRLRRHDGVYRWWLIRGMPLLEADGTVLKWFGTCTDIEDIKTTEQALRESESRLNFALATTNTGAWELNLQDHAASRTLIHDRIFGYQEPLPEWSYERFLDHVLPEDRAEVDRLYRLANATRTAWDFKCRIRRRDGEIRWIWAKGGHVLDAAGKAVRLSGIVQDITDHKTLEEHLRQAQKLDSIGQLAGGVAHDFNNILAAMMMHLSLLQQKQGLDADIQESVQELLGEAQRAAGLTRQLLVFSRRSLLDIKLVNLNEVVSNLLKMLGRLIGEDITIFYERREGLPLIEADAGMMEQVLMNLAVNARDAMPQGGKLSIGIEAVTVERKEGQVAPGSPPAPFVCLTVTDTGCGMGEQTLKHIFEPFFTTKEAGKGTGLGLATVHGIVAQHRGWVEVQSQIGSGTTFRAFFPAAARKATLPNAEPMPELSPGSETILMVEDEKSLRRAVGRILRMLGYEVLEASNGREALKLWQENQGRIHLLMSDMVMPEGVTGLELAEQLRQDRPDLRVIIASGYNEEVTKPGWLAARGTLYLQKPFSLHVMAKAIRTCLDQR